MRKKNIKKEYLPTDLIKQVESLFDNERDYRSKNNLILFVGSIFNKSISDPLYINSLVPLSSEYWRTVIGSHYTTPKDNLLNNNIINYKEDVNYIDENGNSSRVTGYRINPAFLNDDFGVIKYIENQDNKKQIHTSTEWIDEIELDLIGLDKKLSKNFHPQYIKLLKKDALVWLNNNASELVGSYISYDFIKGFPLEMSVKIKTLDDNGKYYQQYISIDSAKRIAQEHGKELFYYNDEFVIADKDQFIQSTTENLIYNYKWRIKSFHPDNFNIKRNKKTLRVYSQLTNFPTALLPFIRINGNYTMQADLKCSQFTLFANFLNLFITNKSGEELVNLFSKRPTKTFMKKLVAIFDENQNVMPENGLDFNNPVENEYETKNNDIYKFLANALLHDFYGVLKNELKLPQRGHAKTLAFRTIFSNPKNTNQYINQFNDIYPSVISIINDFKNKHGYNQFAIGLQNVEAELFIDNIWSKAIQSKINSFTRHDSLVFPINKEDEVKGIINNVFNEFKFIYKIEYESFNEDEIWDRLIDETNYLDSVDDEFDELFFHSLNDTNNDDDGADIGADIDVEYDEVIEDVEYEEENITQENYWTYIQDKLNEAWVKIPEEVMDDYFGCDSIDLLLDELYKLNCIDEKIKKAIYEDKEKLISNAYGQEQTFEDKTNEFITQLIEATNY